MASEAAHEPVATSAPVVASTEAPAETAPVTTTETAPETKTEVAAETTPAPATTTEEPAAAPIEAPTETVVETATESAPTETEAPKTEEAKKTEETPATGLVLHHLEHSRSQRVLWLLEELEAPYSIKVYKRTPQRRAPPELKKISPLGKAPVVTDGDDTVAESAAVMEYILEKYGNGKLQPPASGKLTDRYYLHYAEGSLMPLLGMRIVTSFIPPKAPLLIRPIARGLIDGLNTNYISPELKANLEMIEKHLAKSPTGWFAGGEEPTLCDFMMILPLEAIAATSHGKTENLGPATAAFVKKCHSRPAYLRALEKGEADYHYGPKNSKL